MFVVDLALVYGAALNRRRQARSAPPPPSEPEAPTVPARMTQDEFDRLAMRRFLDVQEDDVRERNGSRRVFPYPAWRKPR